MCERQRQKGAPYCEYGEWMTRTSAIEGINCRSNNYNITFAYIISLTESNHYDIQTSTATWAAT